MRKLTVVVAWLAAAALFAAAPAFAHAYGHAHQAAAQPQALPSNVTKGWSAPCLHRETVVRPIPAQTAAHAQVHDHGDEHKLADHTHPPGADVVHQMLCHHHSVDAAAWTELILPLRRASGAQLIEHRDDRYAGITVLPPVPPPLG